MKANIIKTNKRERLSLLEIAHADMVIVKGVVIKDRDGMAPRPATAAELKAAKQK